MPISLPAFDICLMNNTIVFIPPHVSFMNNVSIGLSTEK